MAWVHRWKWVVGLAAGLVAGLMLGGVWPHTPLHAVATDRADNLVATTAIIDSEVEAIFVLDSMTGVLRGAVPSHQMKGIFQTTWERPVNADLLGYIKTFNAKLGGGRRGEGSPRPEIQVPQTPKYMLTSGLIDFKGGGVSRPARSIIYVIEANTGVVLAYMAPWSSNLHNSGRQAPPATLDLWAAAPFTASVIRADE